MKTLIIYNHPYDGSFCHAILETTKKGLKKAGHIVNVIDLDKECFNPVMTDQDLLAFKNHKMIDQQSKKYITKIKEADHLIFIFPIWWELMPAMTKGFIDKIIFPGSAYDYTNSNYGMTSLLANIKSTTVITTMNTPKSLYAIKYGNAIKNAMIKGTLKKIGLKNIKWISFNQVKRSKESQRKKWLTNLEINFSKKTS